MSVEIDFCEYSSDALAQAAYITNGDYGSNQVPVMTSDILPTGVSSASSVISAGNEAFKAFDGSMTTQWHADATGQPFWLKYQFPAAKIVLRYVVGIWRNGWHPKTWTFQGSNNDSDWDTLDTQTSVSMSDDTKYTYNITNTTAYTYYRMYITLSNNTGTYCSIGELELYVKSLQSYSESTIKTQGTYSLKGIAATTDSLNDILTRNIRLKATGGTITYDGDYTIHTFLSDGTFTPKSAFNVETLVVGGGGGGGKAHAGGGGAGGLIYDSEHAVTAKTYGITVGGGGAGSTSNQARGVNGSNSVFDDKTATGGGGGGSRTDDDDIAAQGADGGSGGGGGGQDPQWTPSPDGGSASPAGQGNDGGDGIGGGEEASGGGGGGAGAVGANAVADVAGAGGAGSDYSTEFGTDVGESGYFAGGGGGGAYVGNTRGAGGTGGGGDGASSSAGSVGTANTGGGGGGGASSGGSGGGSGLAGGSGIVIIKYLGTIDLSDQEVIKMDIRASRTGENIKIGFHDSGGTTTEHTANIASADTFQTETIDISGVANADKDAIDSIIVTITNADA